MIAAAYDILLILPVMLAGYCVAYDFLTPQDAPEGIVRYIIPVLVCGILVSYKHLKNKGRILMSGILLAALLGFFLSLPAGERLESLPAYMPLLWLVLICAGCYIAAGILNRFLKIRAVAALLFTAALPIALINGYNAGKMCVCMVLLYLLLNLTDLVQYHSKKEGDTEREKHLVFVAPFMLAVFVLFAFLPVPEKPYDWTVAKRIGSLVRDAIVKLTDELFTDEEKEAVFIGFSGRGDFSGRLKSRNTVALELHTTTGYDDNLYLAGTRFKDFTGKEWEEDTEAESDDDRFDAIETMCAVLEEDDDGKMNDVLMKVGINVSYRELKNRKIFVPTKSYVITKGADGSAYSYRSMYYRLNRKYDKYEEIMSKEEEITPECWQKAREQLGLDGEAALSYEKYLEYRKTTVEKYLVETEVSEKMRAFLDAELEGTDNDYDKCVKLAALLRDGTYTNEPGELPAGIRDAAGYLDHFIFEKKAGYCSHYATAFVLMARSCGIPARYVQGFRTKVGRKSDTEVRSEAAHAWAEVYFEGVGWIVFEATPGYEVKSSGWKIAAVEEHDRDVQTEADENRAGSEEKDKDMTDGTGEEGKAAIHAERILIPVMAGAVLALILWMLDALYKKRKYKAMSEKDKCLYLCRQYLAMYKRLGYEREENETIGEFRVRAMEVADEDKLDFLETYERLLYSDMQADETMRRGLEEKKKELRSYIKKKRKELKEEELYEEDAQNT